MTAIPMRNRLRWSRHLLAKSARSGCLKLHNSDSLTVAAVNVASDATRGLIIACRRRHGQ